MNYMKFQDGGFEAMMRERAQGDPTKKNGFTLTGQYAGSVEQEGADKQYVMYDMPDGSKVKVYGNWNEYAVARDENGKDMIADDDYPITIDEEGNYVLDERRYEEMMMHDGEGPDDMGEPPAMKEDPTQQMRNETKGGMGASPMEDLMEKLNQSGAKRQSYARGGKVGGDRFGINRTSDLLSALQSYGTGIKYNSPEGKEIRDELNRANTSASYSTEKFEKALKNYEGMMNPILRDRYLRSLQKGGQSK